MRKESDKKSAVWPTDLAASVPTAAGECAKRLAPNRDSQGLHLSIEVAALESQSFGGARNVALILFEFAEDVVALVGGSRLLQ